VIRTVRDASGNVIHTDTISSNYRKVNGIILVGRYPGDPPAGYQWPVSQGIPNAPGPKPTKTPDATKTPKPTTEPTKTPKPKPTETTPAPTTPEDPPPPDDGGGDTDG
jgi:hypothetical protein